MSSIQLALNGIIAPRTRVYNDSISSSSTLSPRASKSNNNNNGNNKGNNRATSAEDVSSSGASAHQHHEHAPLHFRFWNGSVYHAASDSNGHHAHFGGAMSPHFDRTITERRRQRKRARSVVFTLSVDPRDNGPTSAPAPAPAVCAEPERREKRIRFALPDNHVDPEPENLPAKVSIGAPTVTFTNNFESRRRLTVFQEHRRGQFYRIRSRSALSDACTELQHRTAAQTLVNRGMAAVLMDDINEKENEKLLARFYQEMIKKDF